MAKANMSDKLKNMARGLKNENTSGVKKLGDAKREVQKKESASDAKASGRKN